MLGHRLYFEKCLCPDDVDNIRTLQTAKSSRVKESIRISHMSSGVEQDTLELVTKFKDFVTITSSSIATDA